MSKSIREIIREAIINELEELEETSATGNIAGYNTPGAFRGNSPEGKAKQRKNANQAGYTMVERPDEADTLKENRYREFKKDESTSSRQKIGRALSEINKNLQEIDRLAKMSARLKTEENMESTQLWKRTNQALMKIEGTLQQILRSIRELKA